MKKLSRMQKKTARVIAAAVIYIALVAVEYSVRPPFYVSLPLFAALYIFIGYDVAIKAVKGIFGGRVFDENLLMFIAGVGAFAIGEYPEAAAVMVFYQVGELFQSFAVGKSRKSISDLMAIAPDTARVLRNGEEEEVLPEEVEAGETVIVRAGGRIPVDGTVISGEANIDLSALTGEALPRFVSEGGEVLGGSIVLDGRLLIESSRPYSESTVSRILELVENASAKKARTESFITRFAVVYTPVVVALALLIAVVPPLFLGAADGGVWIAWLYRALTFLVVSCPCALVVSVPLSFFGAIGGASASGILIKGGVALEQAEKTDVFIFDKTGTITEGGFTVTEVSGDRDKVLAAAALAESGSAHPIARAVSEAFGRPVNAEGWTFTERAGGGVRAEKGGEWIAAGNRAFVQSNGAEIPDDEPTGTAVYVAKNGIYLGSLRLGSAVKADSAEAIAELKAGGAKCVMLTGDSKPAAERIAARVGIDEFRAELLPADKVTAAEEYLGRRGKTAFVGDGINDAPVLAAADLGIAMGGIGSDSAIEAADVVIMNDSLSALPRLKRIAKKTMRIARFNIVFALAVKVAALALTAAGITGMWLAIFADVGVTVIAVLNSMRMLKKVN